MLEKHILENVILLLPIILIIYVMLYYTETIAEDFIFSYLIVKFIYI